MQLGIEIIDKYTNFFFKKLKSQGFNPEKEEVQGILSETYCKAQKGWKPGKAKFNTYCIRAFFNSISKYRNKLEKNSKMILGFDETLEDYGGMQGYWQCVI